MYKTMIKACLQPPVILLLAPYVLTGVHLRTHCFQLRTTVALTMHYCVTIYVVELNARLCLKHRHVVLAVPIIGVPHKCRSPNMIAIIHKTQALFCWVTHLG